PTMFVGACPLAARLPRARAMPQIEVRRVRADRATGGDRHQRHPHRELATRVQKAANRVGSDTHLKQLALSCYNYHDAPNSFPLGMCLPPGSAAAPAHIRLCFSRATSDRAGAIWCEGVPRPLRAWVICP